MQEISENKLRNKIVGTVVGLFVLAGVAGCGPYKDYRPLPKDSVASGCFEIPAELRKEFAEAYKDKYN